MKKVLFGLTIAGVSLATIYLLKEENEGYAEVNVSEDEETGEVKTEVKAKKVRKIDKIKEKVVTKIKEKGIDKKINAAVAKIVTFILEHKEEIEAASLGLGLVSGVIGAMTAAVKYKVESNKKARMDANEVSYNSLFDEAKERKHPVLISDDSEKDAGWILSYCMNTEGEAA